MCNYLINNEIVETNGKLKNIIYSLVYVLSIIYASMLRKQCGKQNGWIRSDWELPFSLFSVGFNAYTTHFSSVYLRVCS